MSSVPADFRHGRVDVGEKFHTVTHGDAQSLGYGVIVVTWLAS